jgi:hypothetical protein
LRYRIETLGRAVQKFSGEFAHLLPRGFIGEVFNRRLAVDTRQE